MINNTMGSQIPKIAPLFKNNLSKQIQIQNDNKTNISNTLESKNNWTPRANNNKISNDNLLKLYIKGLKIYINNLTSYSLKWNNKNLITTIKNKPLSTIDIPLSKINKKIETNNRVANTPRVANSITMECLKKGEHINTMGIGSQTGEYIPQTKNTVSETTNNVMNTTNNLINTTNNITDTTNNTKNISKYLNSITKSNTIPRGKIFTFPQQLNYNFNNINNKLIKKMYTFLFYSFFSMNSLISKPILETTPENVIINLFFFQWEGEVGVDLKKNHSKLNKRFKGDIQKNLNISKKMDTETIKQNKFININHKKLDLICKILSIYFKKPVELHLVKLYYPYLDSNIFVNLLALMINNKKVRQIMKRFFRFAVIKNIAKLSSKNLIRNNKIPSFLSGIKIKIAGRLLTQRVVPRKTVKIIRRGAFARGKVNFLDVARYTSKNKRGAFSITVTTGQNLII